MEWNFIEAGEYRSKDNRFHILKGSDRINGAGWYLHDNASKKEDFCYSLKHAKQIADGIILKESSK